MSTANAPRRHAKIAKSYAFWPLVVSAASFLLVFALWTVLRGRGYLSWLLAGLGGVLLYPLFDLVTRFLMARIGGLTSGLHFSPSESNFCQHVGACTYTILKGPIVTVVAMGLLTNLTLAIDGIDGEASFGDYLCLLLVGLGVGFLHVLTGIVNRRVFQHKVKQGLLGTILSGPIAAIASMVLWVLACLILGIDDVGILVAGNQAPPVVLGLIALMIGLYTAVIDFRRKGGV
ncbi:MAG: hypothetical protein JXA14_21375 [Anaerolineae bacterium]|nr:hypothetical protein [Anaerolineae bacterium]